MAKAKQKVTAKSSVGSLRSKAPDTSEGFTDYDNYIFIALIILAVFLFFREGVFGGKVFATSDNIASESFRTFLTDAKKNGIFPLWVPYIFMGMPNFPIISYNPRVYDFFYFIWDSAYGFITNSSENTVLPIVMYYVVFGIGFYLYAKYKFKNKLIALYCALSATFAVDFIQRIVVGHNTKVLSLAFFPLIMLALDRLIDSFGDEKKSLFSFQNLLNLFFLTIMLHIQLNSNHIQMIFYSYLMLGIYLLYLIIYNIAKKTNVSGMIKAGVFFIIAALIAVAMNADVLMTMKEYNKYSMRGEAGIIAKLDPKVTNDQPLDYEYATNWSFSPGEVITFVLPYYYGFGDVQVQGQKANLYWGQMPFTTNPMYFGVITLVLCIIGIIYNFRKNPTAQAMTVITVLFLFMSFGRNFSLIFDLFFNYFPYFSSFRAPVMIHHFMNIAIVILAGFGLKSIVEIVRENLNTEKFKKLCFVFFGIAGLMFLISIIGFESSYADSISNSPLTKKLQQQGANAQQISQYLGQISKVAYDNITSDLRLHAFFIAVVIGLAYMFSQKKLSLKMFIIGTILIGIIDLWNVGNKTLHWDNPGDNQSAFGETDYTNWLLKNAPDTYTYRIAEMNGGRLSTSNTFAYYRLHTFNGYHGAKIRIYQDAVDVAGDDNQLLLSLGGVKYIVTDKPITDTNYTQVFKGTRMIYENKEFIPMVFFADEIKVEKDINILNHIHDKDFNPRETAFMEKGIDQKIDKPDSSAYAKLVKGDIHSLEYDVNASGNNLLVFSEIYIPFGWKAYIDGKETDIYKTDYFLRSVVVPQGKHKVEFKYEPGVYYTGKNISMAANGILGIILIAGVIGFAAGRKNSGDKESKENKEN
ncbi:MAG: YfhO family protein [Bacteroidetes bacterium]|nr:YfhO family protein [Bacteroidota bacterium]